MTIIRRSAAWLGLLALILGCGPSPEQTPSTQTPSPMTNDTTPRFVKARITRFSFETRKEELKEVVDPTELERLARFFPGMGEGKEAELAGGWIDSVTITLFDAKENTVTIGIPEQLDAWSEGKGDWDLSPKFAEYLNKLFPPGKKP